MLLKNNLTVMYLGVPENPMAIKDTFPASFSLLLDYIYKGESDFQLFNQVYLSLFLVFCIRSSIKSELRISTPEKDRIDYNYAL